MCTYCSFRRIIFNVTVIHFIIFLSILRDYEIFWHKFTLIPKKLEKYFIFRSGTGQRLNNTSRDAETTNTMMPLERMRERM